MIKKSGLLLLCLYLAGCASHGYEYGTGRADIDRPLSPQMEEQVIVGNPHWFWDKSDWIWPGSWLAKLFLWNRNIDSHTISEETIEYLMVYLELNELDNVQVLVNHYSPGNQWSRLVHNRTVSAGWRYTLGVISVSMYTIMPGRFFGGDAYNPYTNTIYLYSDDVSIALHEGGHAKDFNSRRFKGSYAALYILPFAPLYHEAVATNDALSYMLDNEMTEERKDGYRLLHPAYGTYVGASFGGGYPGISLLGAIPGHITGNIAAVAVKDRRETQDEEKEP